MNETQICCPRCRTPLDDIEQQVALTSGERTPEDQSCPTCGYHYQIRNGIIDFTPEDRFYWGEISQQEMIEINQQAERRGWFQALSSSVGRISNRDLTHYLFDRVRVAGLFHFYDPEQAEAVLDLGSGWGPIAFGLSKFYKTVYSMDGVYERLRFQAIRASQDGVANIRIMKGTLLKLPFEENSINTVIVNGLLEWIGLSDRETNPQELQKLFLNEVYRVLKPGGKLYIGIENRFGAQYLLGGRDHSGLRFTSLMPRRVANWVMKLNERKIAEGGEDFSFAGTGASYRTLTYSVPGYRKLLGQAGFSEPRVYWARADYNYPWISGTLDGDSLKFYLKNFESQASGMSHTLKRWAALLPKKLLGFLARAFSTDLLIVASKGEPAAGLEEKLLPTQKRVSFLRTTLETRADLNTAYWFLDGHGLEKIAQIQPVSQDGTKGFEIQTVNTVNGHPLRPESLAEVQAAAQWLADFQSQNQSGLWTGEELQAEMHDLVDQASQYSEDEDLSRMLAAYNSQYQAKITRCSIPVVLEHGAFLPPNIIIAENETVQVIHWEHARTLGNPMMDAGALSLSMLLKNGEHNQNSTKIDPRAAAIQEAYGAPFALPLSLSPVYCALRSLVREMGTSDLNAENYVSWKYWIGLLKLALRHSHFEKENE